jgi:hypothetical protein
MAGDPTVVATQKSMDPARARRLQLLGILCGFTAGAWLGAAEAPTKLVSIGISPVVISLIMVSGVLLARWSLPALVLGTSSVRADVRRYRLHGRGRWCCSWRYWCCWFFAGRRFSARPVFTDNVSLL